MDLRWAPSCASSGPAGAFVGYASIPRELLAGEASRPVQPVSSARSTADLTQATAKGLRWISASRITTEIFLMFSMVALARLVSPTAFGEFAVAVIIQELAVSIPAEGVGSALVQRPEVDREHLQAGAALTIITAAALGGLVLLLSGIVIAPLLGNGTAALVRLSTPLFVLSALSAVPVALLRRKLDFRLLAVIEIASSASRAAVSLALAAFVGLQGSALVFGGLAAGVVGTTIALLGAPAPLPLPRRKAIRDLAGYGLPASIAAVFWTGFRNGDYAVLNAKLGAAAAGQYWRAYTLAIDYQRKISVVMSTMAFPVLARSQSQADLFALRRRAVRLLTGVIFPMLTTLAITAPTLIPWLFGPAWQSAIVPTQILCVGGAVTLVIDSAGTALMALGRPRALLNFGIAHFATYVGSVVLVAHLGLTAVAIAAAVIHAAYMIIAYAIMLRGGLRVTAAGLWGDVGPATSCCLAMAVAMLPVALLASAAQLPAPLALVCTGAIGATVYLLTLRSGFSQSWGDLVVLVRKLLPADAVRVRLAGGHRRVAALFGSSNKAAT